jgi:hypothetical protein
VTRRRPAAGGGVWVDVAPERLERWIAAFAERHGAVTVSAAPTEVVLAAADGARAECAVPFPPLAGEPSIAGLVRHALIDRRVGVLLVRLGGYAAGVFDGTTLVVSKVGSRPVHGRSAAGGWSQQRFARRREGQARVALDEAADVAARVLAPVAGELAGVVLGGDRRAVAAVLDNARLAVLRPLVTGRVLDVAEPRLAVLTGTARLFRAVQIRVTDPLD